MRGDLAPFLAEHPDGTRHREHGVVTVDHAGESVERERRGRWDYRAPGMRAWCGCGWFGPIHAQVRVPERVGTLERSAEWKREHRAALQAMDQEWSEHVHAALPTLRVLEVMAELRDAERALTAVVIDARSGGASWTDVAEATGMRRQSAHRRWSAHDPLPPEQRSRGGRPARQQDDELPANATAGEAPAPVPLPAPGPVTPSDRAQVNRRLVHALAAELTRRTGRNVEAIWQGTRSRDGHRGGWLLEWTSGPTRAEMRELAVAAVAESRELRTLDLSGVAWERSSGTDVDQAAARLAWLEAHPDDGAQLGYLDADQLPGWPERLPARLRLRAETLVAAGWAPHTAGTVADTFQRHAVEGGPTAVHAWLDDHAATWETVGDAPVGELPTRRANRKTVTDG